MAVNQIDQIDFISLQKGTGLIELTIADHLPWDDNHLLVLQKKFNTYLEYIKSGQIENQFSDSSSRKKLISVEFLHAPSTTAMEFLTRVGSILEEESISLRYRQSHFNSPTDGRWIDLK